GTVAFPPKPSPGELVGTPPRGPPASRHNTRYGRVCRFWRFATVNSRLSRAPATWGTSDEKSGLSFLCPAGCDLGHRWTDSRHSLVDVRGLPRNHSSVPELISR